MDLAAMTPVEIDTELSNLWNQEQRHLESMWHYRSRLADQSAFAQRYHAEYERQMEEAKAAAAELRAKAQPFEDEFTRRGGWQRYFLVKNANGHVHRGMNCSTCFPTTLYAWLIELADCDEDAMIEEWGEMACTVCFPSAPAHPRFSQPSKRDIAAREAKAAEKAEREAAKAAKAITDIDGSALKVRTSAGGWTDTFKTKVAARNGLSGLVQDLLGYYGDGGFRTESIAKLVVAMKAAGMDPADTIRKAAKKVGRTGEADALIEQVAA
jgi:hypothetical protein